MNKLLTVENHFLLTGRGLVVTPLLPLPKDDRDFKPFTDKITVRLPDGTERLFEALFAIEHFSMVGGGSKWNLVINIKNVNKDDVPIGSTISVGDHIVKKIEQLRPTSLFTLTGRGVRICHWPFQELCRIFTIYVIFASLPAGDRRRWACI